MRWDSKYVSILNNVLTIYVLGLMDMIKVFLLKLHRSAISLNKCKIANLHFQQQQKDLEIVWANICLTLS
jgi:hypothetical protein